MGRRTWAILILTVSLFLFLTIHTSLDLKIGDLNQFWYEDIRSTKVTTGRREEGNITERRSPDRLCPLFVAISFKGRLGNQMFEYASALGVARTNGRTPSVMLLRSSILSNTFNLSHTQAVNVSEQGCQTWQTFSEKGYARWDSRAFNLSSRNTTLKGLYQSWKYFASVEQEVRKEFTFKEGVSQKAVQLEMEIRQKHPNRTLVGVHVRRGDFLGLSKAGYATPKETYYFKAFDRMIAELASIAQPPLFVVSSDDLKWCAKNLRRSDVQVLSAASEGVHLAFLSRMSHAVISSGTYSWWAGWLTGGKVIYFSGFPRKGSIIRAGCNPADYYPPHWIGLDDN